jgi:hypothetical protein
MAARLSQHQRDLRIDRIKWESAAAFVAAASALDRAIRTYGLMSAEARDAQRIADAAMKRYKRNAKA